MKAAATIQLVNLFQAERTKENAEKIVEILSEDSSEVSELQKDVKDIKNTMATKDDIITLLTKMESKANWTIGFIAAMLSITIAILKLT